ncbi:methyltransferase family protein [Solibacillus daqui]|uniref:methyltransferase family protein n=1 Tax=Solibacillus daqui TaxID=2912187 RepID=UPI0023657C7F|nr:methyltransferase [Solibacillus daqui]
MTLVSILSLLLFVIFLSSYISKLIIMNKKSGIKALVLAKGNKGKTINFSESLVRTTTFLWGATWLLESIFSNWLDDFLPNLFTNNIINYLGLLIILIGLIFFVSSMITMKNSWRVGIDKDTKTQLITNGLYKYSRNPAFVGFDLMFMGLFITFPNIVTLFICLINILAIHNLILQEEKHLENTIQEDYLFYKYNTPRYLIF